MAPSAPMMIKATTYPRWFTPLCVVAALVAMAGAFVGYDAMRSAIPNNTLGAAGGGAVLVALALVLGAKTFTAKFVQVDSDGAEVRARSGSTRIRWAEAHDFFYCGVTGTGTPEVTEVAIVASDGRRIEIQQVRIADQPNVNLPKVVEQQSTAANWPKIQARLEAEEQVKFGAVKMNREKIEIGGESFSLDHSVTLQIEEGKLKIGAAGEWVATKVAVNDVANYPSLLRAIGQVAQAAPPG